MYRFIQLSALLALLTCMVAADTTLVVFNDRDCQGSGTEFQIQSGSKVVQTQPFQSFRTTVITNNDIVTVCAQGFSCAQANLNANIGLQQCVNAPSGSFDKIDDELGN